MPPPTSLSDVRANVPHAYPRIYNAQVRDRVRDTLYQHMTAGDNSADSLRNVMQEALGPSFSPATAGPIAADLVSELGLNFGLTPMSHANIASPSPALRGVIPTDLQGLFSLAHGWLNPSASRLPAPQPRTAPSHTPPVPEQSAADLQAWEESLAFLFEDARTAPFQANVMLKSLALPGARPAPVEDYGNNTADLVQVFGSKAEQARLIINHVNKMLGRMSRPEAQVIAPPAPQGDEDVCRQLQEQEHLWARLDPSALGTVRDVLSRLTLVNEADDDADFPNTVPPAQTATAVASAAPTHRAPWAEVVCARSGAVLVDPHTLPDGTTVSASALTANDAGAIRDFTMRDLVAAWNAHHSAPQEALHSALVEALHCPVGMEPLHEAVLASDGYTYNASVLTTWMENHTTSPITRAELSSSLVPHTTVCATLVRLGVAAPVDVVAQIVARARPMVEMPEDMTAATERAFRSFVVFLDIEPGAISPEAVDPAYAITSDLIILEANQRQLLGSLRNRRRVGRLLRQARNFVHYSIPGSAEHKLALRLSVETELSFGSTQTAYGHLAALTAQGEQTFFESSRLALALLQMKRVPEALQAAQGIQATEMSLASEVYCGLAGELYRRAGNLKVAEALLRQSAVMRSVPFLVRAHGKAQQALRREGLTPFPDTEDGLQQLAAALHDL